MGEADFQASDDIKSEFYDSKKNSKLRKSHY